MTPRRASSRAEIVRDIRRAPSGVHTSVLPSAETAIVPPPRLPLVRSKEADLIVRVGTQETEFRVLPRRRTTWSPFGREPEDSRGADYRRSADAAR